MWKFAIIFAFMYFRSQENKSLIAFPLSHIFPRYNILSVRLNLARVSSRFVSTIVGYFWDFWFFHASPPETSLWPAGFEKNTQKWFYTWLAVKLYAFVRQTHCVKRLNRGRYFLYRLKREYILRPPYWAPLLWISSVKTSSETTLGREEGITMGSDLVRMGKSTCVRLEAIDLIRSKVLNIFDNLGGGGNTKIQLLIL